MVPQLPPLPDPDITSTQVRSGGTRVDAITSHSSTQMTAYGLQCAEAAEKRLLDHISKFIWVERDRYVTLLGKCIAHGDKKSAATYELIARAFDDLHEGIQP